MATGIGIPVDYAYTRVQIIQFKGCWKSFSSVKNAEYV